MRVLGPVLLLMVVVASCAGDGDDATEETAAPGTSTPAVSPAPDWEVVPVSDLDIGLQTRLVVAPDDTVTLVTWANAPYDDGVCDEVETNPPPRMRQVLYFGQRPAGTLDWTLEQVDAPVVAFRPTGVSLAYASGGTPAIAYTGGEPQDQYCGANDAVLATRSDGAWTMEVASAESDDSATGLEASDAGFVVGLWPGLAFDSAGEPAIVHQDVHFGTLQHDDQYRADAEFAWRIGDVWTHEAIDPGEGAGNSGALVFDDQDRPIAFYAITVDAQDDSRLGVWAARRDPDSGWIRVKLHTGPIDETISAATDPVTGAPVVAFYSVDDRAAKVRTLTDPENFDDPDAWSSELVASALYDEGQSVSMAFAPDGTLGLAYHRCRRLTSSDDGCDQNDEAVVFAYRSSEGEETDGDAWSYDVVFEASRGSCGNYPALDFDSTGRAHIAFRCTVEVDGDFVFHLFEATGSRSGWEGEN